MPRLQLNLALAAAALIGAASIAACSSNTRPPGITDSTTTGTGGTTSTGTQAGGGGAGGSEQGGGGAGTGGMLEGCGDGKIVFPEQCDGSDLNGKNCVDYGFEGGTLACNPNNCQVDVAKCVKKELCSNGIDDNVNSLIDCQDPDCTAACADSCSPAAIVVSPGPPFPFELMGFTTGHANQLDATCTSSGGTKSGPEIVYEVTAAVTGVIEIALESPVDMGVSVRAQCAQAAELGCADHDGPGAVERLKLPITAGDKVFVVVQGHAPADAGLFTLIVDNRMVDCGDGFLDQGEQCDDGNGMSADGCSSVCKLESKETEANNTTATANAYSSPWYAAISPAGDVDVVSVVVQGASSTIQAKVLDFDGHSCTDGLLDSYLEIIDKNGIKVIAQGDDMGMSSCSAIQATNLGPGTYFVRTTASPVAVQQTFPYKLDVQITDDVCGDGTKTSGEQCDDGNVMPGDGCSPACLFELTELEPNATPMSSNPFKDPWHAAIMPAGDVDVVSVTVPAGGMTISAVVIDHGTGDCAAQKIISHLDILATNGTTILASNEGNGNYCAGTSVDNLAPGKYYVRVKAGPLGPNATFSYGLQITVL